MPSGDADLLDLASAATRRSAGRGALCGRLRRQRAEQVGQTPPRRNWFAAQTAQLQQAVCGHAAVQRYVTNKDAIRAQSCSTPCCRRSPRSSACRCGGGARQIVRYGVTNLCGCDAVPPPATAASPALPTRRRGRLAAAEGQAMKIDDPLDPTAQAVRAWIDDGGRPARAVGVAAPAAQRGRPARDGQCRLPAADAEPQLDRQWRPGSLGAHHPLAGHALRDPARHSDACGGDGSGRHAGAAAG